MRCKDLSQTVTGRSPPCITGQNPGNSDSPQTGKSTGTSGFDFSPFQMRSHPGENSLTKKKSVELPTSTQPTHPDQNSETPRLN
ncbi:hypothetical protein [Phormidium pseudopriestleyi]|uniref:hypothetical protein n=1 Tax=Phormidium pseudopriestleyi TaxID=1759527 RepID=UPI001A8C0E25|nr:hypothetical protein [Phormidium pseudopriestleyi]